MEEELIEKAKRWAKERHISLSQAVAEFFVQVSEDKGPAHLTPWTLRLAGIASDKSKPPTDKKIRKDYWDYLEAKHK